MPVARAGLPLGEAKTAMILVHGRGATAHSILELGPFLMRDDMAVLAPQAAGGTWYPYSFLERMELNEPGISSGMAVLRGLLAEIEEAGVPAERVVIGGFSQGACLASEFVARHARRYGGLLGFSGGLIGPPGTARDYAGRLDGMPVFLGCSDVDPHIPLSRVQETTEVLRRMGAQVTERIYRNMGHTIVEDEIEAARGIVAGVL
jgi:predicted esterase